MLLELRQVEKSYRSPQGVLSPVLRGISLTLDSAESLAIVGPSGSGKSTLLNLMGGLDRPTAGSIILAGRDLAHLSDDQLALIRNREIGFIFQLHHLLPQCTVWENVLLPTLPRRSFPSKGDVLGCDGSAQPPPGGAAEARALNLLQQVGLGERIDYRPGQLSGGERQRVAVVRALINQPRLLLADEPTGALDHTTAEKLVHLLVELNQKHRVALVLVTHAEDLARKMNRVCRLENGQLAGG
jgi:ABC-type lipoprotein export system ATPase subunit